MDVAVEFGQDCYKSQKKGITPLVTQMRANQLKYLNYKNLERLKKTFYFQWLIRFCVTKRVIPQKNTRRKRRVLVSLCQERG